MLNTGCAKISKKLRRQRVNGAVHLCEMLLCSVVLYHVFEKLGERYSQSFGWNTVEFLVMVHVCTWCITLRTWCITDRKFLAVNKTGVPQALYSPACLIRLFAVSTNESLFQRMLIVVSGGGARK
jgi:hypothetical protein